MVYAVLAVGGRCASNVADSVEWTCAVCTAPGAAGRAPMGGTTLRVRLAGGGMNASIEATEEMVEEEVEAVVRGGMCVWEGRPPAARRDRRRHTHPHEQPQFYT